MFYCSLLIFSKLTFSKNSLRNMIKVSNNLDPTQTQQLDIPDHVTNNFQKFSSDKQAKSKNQDSVIFYFNTSHDGSHCGVVDNPLAM